MVGGPLSDDGLCCDYCKDTTLSQYIVTGLGLRKTINFGADGFCKADGTSDKVADPRH